MQRFEISILFSIYGSLLTERQKEMLSLYYDRDLSLSELSEMFLVTRQAARDAIKRGEESLENYESVLGNYKQTKRLSDISTRLLISLDCGDIAAARKVADELKSLTEE